MAKYVIGTAETVRGTAETVTGTVSGKTGHNDITKKSLAPRILK